MILANAQFPARHGFTTRQGGVSTGPFASLNVANELGDDPDHVTENRQRIMAAFGRPDVQPHTVTQVHGAQVAVVSEMNETTEADAVMSDQVGDVLAVRTADCLPLLLVAPDVGVAAAVHAGWRGTVAGVVPTALAVMRERYGVTHGALHAVIGPHARQASYQVGPEVQQAFRQAGYPQSVLVADAQGRYRLSVAAAVRHDLAGAGIPSHQVLEVDGCTIDDADRFYSHRRDGARTGRHWALVEVPPRKA